MNTTSETIKDEVWKIMQANQRVSGEHTYTVPSPDSYPFQWFWDSCFHAVILSYYDVALAKAELRALAAKQFKNGMIPHMIYWQKQYSGSFPKIRWGKRHTSSIIQPPLLSYAVWKIYQTDHDKEFLREMLPTISKFHHYLLYYRDPHKHNLIGLIHPDESGEDNSPRFDHALSLRSRQTINRNYKHRLRLIELYRQKKFVIKRQMERFHWVRDVPINAILVQSLRYTDLIAQELGATSTAHNARQQSTAVASAMRENMLQGSVMHSTDGLDYRPIRVKTWAMFAPLFAEILTQEEANELVKKHLKNPSEFKTKFGVPTVALGETSFDPAGFWRGPTWIATNWLIHEGLLNYGFVDEAQTILDDSLELLEQSGFREQFNPITGEGMGARGFTWGGLVIDMMAKQPNS